MNSEIYDRLVSEQGTVIILVKKEVTFKNTALGLVVNEDNSKLYLHSLKLDTFLEENKRKIIVSIYYKNGRLNQNHFKSLPFVLENEVWKCDLGDHDLIHFITANLTSRAVGNGLDIVLFNNTFGELIQDSLKSFIPSGSWFTNAIKDNLGIVFSSENVGLLTNETISTIHTNEENFYLSDERIKDNTKDGISSLLDSMVLPNAENISGVELNGAFRISYKL